MPEHQLPVPAPATESHTQASYEEVLTRPDLHPVLRPHLERLIASEHEAASPVHIVTNKLLAYAQAVETAPAHLGKGRPAFDEMYNLLAGARNSTEEVQGFVAASLRASKAERQAYAEAGNDPSLSSISLATVDALMQVPEQVQSIYFSKESRNIRELLKTAEDHVQVEAALALTTVLYGYDDVLDLVIDDAARQDPTVTALLRKPSSIEALLSTLKMEHHTLWPDTMPPEEKSIARRDWADRYLERVVKLPEKLRDDLQFAWMSRTSYLETGLANENALYTALEDVTYQTARIPLQDLERLHDSAGLVNLDYYQSDQLELMADLVYMDEETIAYLQAGDVTAVFTDAFGDYNGAFKNNHEKYATESGRTLFFEVTRPRGLYAAMIFLKNAGVKPSTLVVAGHGAAGEIYFGKGKDEFSLAAGIDGPAHQFALTLSKALPRLVSDEFMQASRGIDDNPEAIGRRRVIMNSCCQANPTTVVRPRLPENSLPKLDEQLEWREPGKAPMVRTRESMAESMTRLMNNPQVDTYAAAEEIGVFENDGQTGLRFKYITNENTPYERLEHLPVSHFSMDRFGNLVRQEIDELILRRDEA
ncbi:MAG TPA: hypothetical protein VJR27_02875 [Candidatus Saccharimonadales bacterium]|nr:hypothetical protein [Candidatus Saccharimonadales bacterium]